MAEIVVTKADDGKLHGVTDADERRLARFRGHVDGMAPGDTAKFSFKIPRSPGFHRRHFKILSEVFKAQEQFQDAEKMREWLEVGAGFADIVPGPKGKPVAMARSIAWDVLDDADFAEHHAAVIGFLRSTYCTRFLWPQMSDLDADTFINGLLMEFGA